MPLHRIYAPPGTFSIQDKSALSKRITDQYVSIGLPAFYVVVLFIEIPEESFYVGGEPRKNFVRIVSQQIARVMDVSDYHLAVEALEHTWAPFIKDRGLEWEMHIEEHPRELWRVQGMVAPMPGTDAEQLWVKENKPVPYEL